MTGPGQNGDRKFTDKVGVKQARKMRARRGKESVWFGLGMIGTIGWSVAVPTLAGIALGVWLDSRLPGRISWTLTFLVAGLVAGCFNAYHWVTRELRRIRERQDDE